MLSCTACAAFYLNESIILNPTSTYNMSLRRSHRGRGNKDYIFEISDSSEDEGQNIPPKRTMERFVSRASRETMTFLLTFITDAVETFLWSVTCLKGPL